MSIHLHCFLEFNNPLYLVDVRQIVVNKYPNCHIDVQFCKSKKTVLKYITKEDIDCYFNCNLSMLHFNKRCYEWARSITSFIHTFVIFF